MIADELSLVSPSINGARRQRQRWQIYLAAGALEASIGRINDWFENDPITELGGYTALQLLEAGGGERVVTYLREIALGQRG